ncbi:response regulator [Bradyrhizobium sp. CCGB12]|uniref:response regulator n=1 Tax=Bradyrhizobium sp. CCGB12 TaxID=2949632 RepID=UPI0020B1C0B3|nr:response regulator [Bradyrhizobium sp. CCGB12]MCP3395515.1 response regulator [Bradyrhizobium sp. CCGB12]
MIPSRPLEGVSVLVLEDNYYIAEESQLTLEDAGARVLGPCRNLEETLETLEADHPQCALVDVNLGEGPTFEPARALRAAGVSVLLVTGYDSAIVPADLKDVPCLQKPVDSRRLVSAVASASAR